MDLIQILVLAAVQGVTEFLPISSNAHLILVESFAQWPDVSAIRIAVHVGSLGAVLIYFRSDIWSAITGAVHVAIGRNSDDARLAIHLFVGSVPVIAAGAAVVLLGVDQTLTNPTVIAWAMVGFGVVLWLADRMGMTVRRIEHMTGGAAMLIGLAQVLALIPGTSRAGITITAARMLGYERTEASRFAMLLAVPVIVAVGGWQSFTIWRAGDVQLGLDMVFAATVAFLTAYLSVSLLMAWLRRSTFTPFVLYRLIVGGALLYSIYYT